MLYQAKRRKEAEPDEALRQCTYNILGIFARRPPQVNNREEEPDFGQVNRAAMETLSEAENARERAELERRAQEFTTKIFEGEQMGKRPSDINYDYVGHLYMLYPNV